jgi:hypothetical protein
METNKEYLEELYSDLDANELLSALIDKTLENLELRNECEAYSSSKDWNDDLFLVADRVGIKREHIIFTNFENKSEHLNNKGFKWHIDDDSIELSFIKTDTDLKPIFLFENKKWQSDCENALK